MAKIMKVIHSCAECMYLKRYKREGVNNDLMICEYTESDPIIIAAGTSERFYEITDPRCPLEDYERK